MRWIFMAVAALNFIVLIWGLGFRDPVSSGNSAASLKPYAHKNIPELELISSAELAADIAEDAVAPEEQVQSSPVIETQEQKKPLCEMVGVFPKIDEAEEFSSRLNAIDIAHEIKEVELVSGERYWVHLAPESSKGAALERLASLQAQKIDSYFIPRGDLANSISLGVFSRRELADMRVEELRKAGLEPQLTVKEQTYRETWVMLGPGEHNKMSNLTWERVMGEDNSLERRQNFCLDVAS